MVIMTHEAGINLQHAAWLKFLIMTKTGTVANMLKFYKAKQMGFNRLLRPISMSSQHC